jgi:hypothetical protein
MEKAYDVKELALKLKSKGLNVAEEAAEAAADAVFEWFEESAKLSANKFDDMVLVVLPQVKEIAKGEIDKIDGQVGA